MDDKNKFIDVLNKIGPEHVKQFFETVSDLLKALQVASDDQRVSFTLDKDRLVFIIGNRYCFAYRVNETNPWYCIQDKNKKSTEDIYVNQYEGQPTAYIYHFFYFKDVLHYMQGMVNACKNELSRIKISRVRKHNNIAFEQSIFDPQVRNKYFESAFTDEPNEDRVVWKLGCNWGSGMPSFYEMLRSKSMVLGVDHLLYSPWDLILVTEGHQARAICQILEIPTPVTEFPELKKEFAPFEIDYKKTVNICKVEWYELRPDQAFNYQLQKGICRINAPHIKEKTIKIWEDRFIDPKEKNNSVMNSNLKLSLNTILYGPPGTGKTYSTIAKAIEIISPGFDRVNSTREQLKKEYERLRETGQIEFVTFHQSLTYEDFIEGIKPVKPDNAEIVHYEVQNGVFKNFCEQAMKTTGLLITIEDKERALTRELFNEIYNSYAASLPDQQLETSSVSLKTKEDYTFELFRNSTGSIVVKAGQKKGTMSLTANELFSVLSRTKEPWYKSYTDIVINEILKDKNLKTNSEDNSKRNFVLIIDEINRGNVSQIFGELITLIEDNKRLGKSEALTVTLPYSKKSFGVPSNVYLIGTMNTADRSVEALDTALRRRFMFEEIIPDPNTLQKVFDDEFLRQCVEYDHLEWSDPKWLEIETSYIDVINDDSYRSFKDAIKKEGKKVLTIDEYKMHWQHSRVTILTVELLEIINKRILVLLGRDHQIGHAFFIQKYTWTDLKLVFHKNIIPLLQEYFYGDYGKIGLVLGEGFFENFAGRQSNNPFAEFGDYSFDHFLEKPQYLLRNILTMSDEEFAKALTKTLNGAN